jgi:acyl-CoA reductase-like NAD-dependent aldehyde dehydrogenase
MRTMLLIDGEWVAGASWASSYNPATEEAIGEFAVASPEQVAAATTAARAAFPAWADTPVTARASLVRAGAQVLLERKDALRALITREMGKPIPEADIEVAETADMLLFLAEATRSTLVGEVCSVDETLFPGKMNFTSYRPLGVVGAIKPWNYPLELPAWSAVAALLAGNTVVLKPSELAPLVAEAFVRCLHDAGLPRGVLNLVTGGPDVGRALVATRPDCLSFTGSLSVGRGIAQELGGFAVRMHLELGGKDAFIVCGDADLELAARGAAWGAFTNCGQVCVSAERLIVVRSVADRFLSLLSDHARALRIGDPNCGPVDVGPLVSERARAKVEAQVAAAISEGAEALLGGRRPDAHGRGYFYMPTILTGVKPSMTVWREETFGPVAPVVVVEDEDEAIRLANDSDYDLGASIWTTSLTHGLGLSRRVRAGLVWVNDVNVAFPSGPWGGLVKSGGSKELSRRALVEYSGETTVSVDYNRVQTRPWWYPYGQG